MNWCICGRLRGKRNKASLQLGPFPDGMDSEKTVRIACTWCICGRRRASAGLAALGGRNRFSDVPAPCNFGRICGRRRAPAGLAALGAVPGRHGFRENVGITCTCRPRCARGRSPKAWIQGKCRDGVLLVHPRATTCTCRPRCARGRPPTAWIQGKCRDRVTVCTCKPSPVAPVGKLAHKGWPPPSTVNHNEVPSHSHRSQGSHNLDVEPTRARSLIISDAVARAGSVRADM